MIFRVSALVLAVLMGVVCQPAVWAQEGKEEEIAALKRRLAEQEKLIQQILEANRTLQERVESLEKAQKKEAEEPPIPEVALPTEKPDAAPKARASLLPDISVIGNNTGRFLSMRGDPDRNRLQLGEFEIGLQQRIYPGIRFDAFLAGGADHDFSLSVEEAYATFTNVARLPFGGVLGQKRSNFGKVNPIHPHARLFVDQPAALGAFLGEEALFGNGAALNYTLPVKNLFANLEVGFYKKSGHSHAHEEDTHDDHDHEDAALAARSRAALAARRGRDEVPHAAPGIGIQADMPLARLWLSKPFGNGAELEIGGSHAFGKADNGDLIGLTGLDLTFRAFPGAHSRLLLQGEFFRHRRKDREFGTGAHSRSGHYALLSYKQDKYSEFGFRYDNSRFPWPLDGREQTYSLIYTNRLTEATLLRLQYKFGDRKHSYFLPEKRGLSELYLQFIWGGGSHTHPIQ